MVVSNHERRATINTNPFKGPTRAAPHYLVSPAHLGRRGAVPRRYERAEGRGRSAHKGRNNRGRAPSERARLLGRRSRRVFGPDLAPRAHGLPEGRGTRAHGPPHAGRASGVARG